MQLPRAGRVFFNLSIVLHATEKPESALLGQL
jgi:hypothetical protein